MSSRRQRIFFSSNTTVFALNFPYRGYDSVTINNVDDSYIRQLFCLSSSKRPADIYFVSKNHATSKVCEKKSAWAIICPMKIIFKGTEYINNYE